MACGTGGTCSSGGCNRMNTYDWFAGMPLAFGQKEFDIVEVSFKEGAHKDYFWNEKGADYCKGDKIAVETPTGYDVGEVSLKGELVRLQLKKKKIDEKTKFLKILRIATENDLKSLAENRKKENNTMLLSRVIARELNLNMKIGDVEYQADGKRATFYYIADERIDFRELIKRYAAEFRVKVEMKHIGARQEAARIGGIGSCGRELCCSSWLGDYPTVNTSAARYQNLSINSEKLSGQCGRLKCCLNYELDSYLDALKDIPSKIEKLDTMEGMAYLRKTEILKKVMWFEVRNNEDRNMYKLDVNTVREIAKMNAEGQKPQSLEELAIPDKPTEKDTEKSEELVGQIDFRSPQHIDRKGPSKKKKPRSPAQAQGQGRNNPPANQTAAAPNKLPNEGQGPNKGNPRNPNSGPNRNNNNRNQNRNRPPRDNRNPPKKDGE